MIAAGLNRVLTPFSHIHFCRTLIIDMAQRFHLEQEEHPEGTIWFTLVFESYANFFVERYNDSDMAFIVNRLQEIRLKDFDKYLVNGVPLKKLVAARLEEIESRDKFSLAHADRGGVKFQVFWRETVFKILWSQNSTLFLLKMCRPKPCWWKMSCARTG